jgi:uncharacterized protein involved in type VI secretion and phage assembly
MIAARAVETGQTHLPRKFEDSMNFPKPVEPMPIHPHPIDPLPIEPPAPRYFGKYRGVVVENIDPEQIGRIIAQVPDVLGATASSWAIPCVPAAGTQAGCFIVPPIGSQIWMEFEAGNPDYPIWTGGFWGSIAEVPVLASAQPPIPPGQNIVLQTTGQNAIALSDAAPTPAGGGILLKSANGATICVNDSGIYISNGQGATITLVGPTVTVNGKSI